MKDIIELDLKTSGLKLNYDYYVRKAEQEDAYLIVKSNLEFEALYKQVRVLNIADTDKIYYCYRQTLVDGRIAVYISKTQADKPFNQIDKKYYDPTSVYEGRFSQLDEESELLVDSYSIATNTIYQYCKARGVARKGRFLVTEQPDGQYLIQAKRK